MYAVIKTGGKQHKVKAGDTISVAMYHDSGSTIAFKGALDVYRVSY